MASKIAALAEQTGFPATGIPPSQRAVVVCGARTPFTRAFGEFLSMDTIALGCAAVEGLLERSKVPRQAIEYLVWGGVIFRAGCPNTAREIVIDLKLPPSVAAHTVSMACASGLQAVVSAVQMIESGHAGVVVAGGSDSTSCAELPLARIVTQSLALYSYGRIGLGKLLSTAGLPCGWMPPMPAVAERSTGQKMGWHADVMAGLCGVSREAQDRFALASHENAAAAEAKGVFKDEVVSVKALASPLLPAPKPVARDTLVRAKQDPAKVAKLPPVFRPASSGGTITAATASPLTDGAACCLLMSAAKARELGFRADVGLRAWAASGIDPQPNLLLAPALAIPVALQRAGLKLDDIDFFEIHEAFAGQVLATINVLGSAELSAKYLNLKAAVGTIPLEKVNIYGGSVSIGHPFGATGARLTTNAARLLRNHEKARYVLVSVCAAGGLGLVSIFEKLEA